MQLSFLFSSVDLRPIENTAKGIKVVKVKRKKKLCKI